MSYPWTGEGLVSAPDRRLASAPAGRTAGKAGRPARDAPAIKVLVTGSTSTSIVKAIRQPIQFDHGAALRVPPARDVKGRNALWRWLGASGFAGGDGEDVQVRTREGAAVARPGDWIVLSVSGDFYVTRSANEWTN